ncbi:hypothetical protein BBO_01648 [Beauveria brongniartii RCEF 3172]|uniref:Store-operated calcium entry-associated regulatory factor n=1 Tax=Beauveria brongniartii RCEF 3172 TaxID=1081107 RepID=A0A167JAT5_9HYPO|nr:hypothetical protein BBO_01648 [Beauveria brongniartii RCEF 3172]
MHLPGALVLSFGLAASAVSAKQQQRPPPAKSAVLLSSVQSLTLRGRGAKTSHRRVPAAPQLRCVSPRALCDLHAIDVMRCTNQGSSYGDEDVEWSCAASLPAELKLGATDVVCEGYASSDDPYVLKGSCGVEYTLALTELGERRYPDLARGGDRWFGDAQSRGNNNAWAGLFFLVFVAVVAWIVYSACVAASDNNRRQANTARRYGGGGDGGGSGGGGGGGGWGPGGGGWGPRNDPPPPYPGTNNSYKSSSNGGSSSQQQQGWRPGFWTGLAGGAAASYLASGRNRDNRNNYGYAPWGSNNYGSGSGSRWGGGDSWAGPSSSSSSSRGGGSSSGERHESTGFGSTRRR